MTTIESDSFIRTSVTNGFGTATDGNAWYNAQGAASSLATTGTQGKVFSSATNRSHLRLGVTTYTDQDVLARFTPSSTSDDFGVDARCSGDAAISGVTSYRFNFNGAGQVVCSRINAGTGTAIGSGVSKTITAGSKYWIRLRATGAATSVTLQGRLWADGGAEPSTWDLNTTDTSGIASGAPGLTGIAVNSTGILIDSFTATDGSSITTQTITVTELTAQTEIVSSLATTTRNITEVVAQTETITALSVSVAGAVETAQQSETVSSLLITLSSGVTTESVAQTETLLARLLTLAQNSVTESVAQTEIINNYAITQSLPTAQMQASDLAIQYSRIIASAAGAQLKRLATIYYGTSANNQAIYGELDAILKSESITNLHVLRTINDVSNFLKSYSYATNILADQPIAYYRLSDASGSAALDLTGHGFNGSYAGSGVTYGATGALAVSPDTAITLNGSSGYVALPATLNTANLRGFSVECWIKPAVVTGTPRIIANANPGSDLTGIQLALNGSGAFFGVGTGASQGAATLASGSFTAGIWAQVVGTFDGSTIRVYLNGALAGTASLSGAIAPAANPLNIGRNPAYAGDYFNGSIDDVSFYNYPLSGSRILANYNAGINPS